MVENKSNAVNTIHVGAHTWRKRSYNKNCNSAFEVQGGRKHSIYRWGDTTLYQFNNNERWVKPYDFAGGAQHMYILELDMDRPGMANDWSFTAWGENAEVEITVVGRLSET